jgi:hypothetical protein
VDDLVALTKKLVGRELTAEEVAEVKKVIEERYCPEIRPQSPVRWRANLLGSLPHPSS